MGFGKGGPISSRVFEFNRYDACHKKRKAWKKLAYLDYHAVDVYRGYWSAGLADMAPARSLINLFVEHQVFSITSLVDGLCGHPVFDSFLVESNHQGVLRKI